MLKILSNIVSDDGKPDIIVSGGNFENAVPILTIICFIACFLLLIGSVCVYYYIQSLKDKIKELENKNTPKKSESKAEEEHD